MSDAVLPIVFPDYKITVIESTRKFDWLPRTTLDDFQVEKTSVPELGHAGVLFFSAKGSTRYFEYGRYDPPANKGEVKKRPIPDRVMQGSMPTMESLAKVLHAITKKSGQGGRVSGVYIAAPGKFDAMLSYATLRQKQNTNPARKPYDLLRNSCIHFATSVVEAAGAETPWMIDPRPNSYIGEFRDSFPAVDYDPLKPGTASISQ